MKRLLACACLLVACAAPVSAPGGPPLPNELQRYADQYTATAEGLATQNAVATARRISTVEALQNMQDLATLEAAHTQSAIAATEQSDTKTQSAVELTEHYLRAEQTAAYISTQSAAATLTAIPLTQAYVKLQITAQAERSQTDSNAYAARQMSSAVWSILLALSFAMIAIYVFWWVGGVIRADLLRRRGNAAWRDTAFGPAVVSLLPNGQLDIRLLNPPAGLAQSLTNATDGAERIPVKVAGQVVSEVAADWRSAGDMKLRAEIADLLRASIQHEGAGGTKIPRHHHIGYHADQRKRLTDALMLAGLVTKANDRGQNSGTWLTAGRTLYQLLQGIESGSLSISPVEINPNGPPNGTERAGSARTALA